MKKEVYVLRLEDTHLYVFQERNSHVNKEAFVIPQQDMHLYQL